MWGPPVQMYVKWQAAERKVDEQQIVDEITGGMPLGDEIPTDDDVAEAIGFFCSDRSRMVTGETLQVHAGERGRAARSRPRLGWPHHPGPITLDR